MSYDTLITDILHKTDAAGKNEQVQWANEAITISEWITTVLLLSES